MAIFERKHVPRAQPSCHDLFEYLRENNIFDVDRFLRSLRFGRLDSFERPIDTIMKFIRHWPGAAFCTAVRAMRSARQL